MTTRLALARPDGTPIMCWEEWTRPKMARHWNEGRTAMELAKSRQHVGLNQADKRPRAISLAQAYEHIGRWYAQNLPLLRQRMGDREYGKRSEALIKALPPASALTDLEIRAVLREVVSGNLEWAYHDTDGQCKMSAYAHGALEAAGLNCSLSESEEQELKGSKLWPHLMINRE